MNKDNPTPTAESFLPAILAAAVILAVAYIRIRLLPAPLERDEGEFAYMGQLLLKGIPPYTNAYTMKLPGVSALYAVCLFLFGQTAWGVHMGLLLINGICILLLFLLARRLADRETALASSAVYAILSLSQSVYGMFAHATHFVVLFSLAGFVLLLDGMEKCCRKRIFASGLCLGLAVMMKQHAVPLAAFAVLHYLLAAPDDSSTPRRFRIAGAILILAGICLPYLALLVLMAATGSFETFWFWTVRYAAAYVSDQGVAQGMANFWHSFTIMLEVQWPFWLLAAAGGVFLWRSTMSRTHKVFILWLLCCSFLAVSPGLWFTRHYFILLLPVIALLAGMALQAAGRLLSRERGHQAVSAALLLAAAAYGFYQERFVFFELSPTEASRASYDENPFPEALPIAAHIKNNTSPRDRIAVLGSEPEIYFYADRLSATGHIYMYGLMERQPYAEMMQEQMIREVEAARPAYLVDVSVAKSWLIRPTSPHTLLNWKKEYLRDHYDRVGVVDIVDSATTRYVWGPEARSYTPVSHAFVEIFRRRGEGTP